MAGTPRGAGAKKRVGAADAENTSSTKRIKRGDTAMTAEEVANFLPKPAVEYVRESKDRQEYMQRLQVLFAYLFYRCSYYPENQLKSILGIVRPPGFRATAGELKDAQDLILSLLGTVMHAHMRLTTHFIKNTNYGREFYETAEKRRRSKLKLPDLDVDQIFDILDLSVAVVRTVWYPLAVVVPMAIWEPIDTVDSDCEEWETETPTVAFFRGISAELVAKTARVWTVSQQELSTHVQVSILKDLSATLHASEWPKFVVTNKFLRFFRKGVYAPDNIDAFFDKVFVPKVAETLPQEVNQELPDKQRDGSPDGTTEGQPEDILTQGSTKTIEATPSPAENTQPKASENDFDTDGLEDIDAVIQNQINAALESVEVTGRPMTFGSEFSETGGRGLGAKPMTELMDHHEGIIENVQEVLDETADALLKHPYIAEEAIAVSSMCAGAAAKYAVLRLEQENTAIMEGIWRLQQIVDGNESELTDIRSRIAIQMEKRKFWDGLNARMHKTYSDIHSEQDVLDKMEGTEFNEDVRETGQSSRKTWQERAREAQHGKVGMKWGYNSKQEDEAGPVSRKSWQDRARETHHGKIGMKWASKRDEVRSSQTPNPARSVLEVNQPESVTESQQKETHAVGASAVGDPTFGASAVGGPTFGGPTFGEDKGDGSVKGVQSQS